MSNDDTGQKKICIDVYIRTYCAWSSGQSMIRIGNDSTALLVIYFMHHDKLGMYYYYIINNYIYI